MSVFEGLSRVFNNRHDVDLFCAIGTYFCYGTHKDSLLENIHIAYCKLKLYGRLAPGEIPVFFDEFIQYYLTTPVAEWAPFVRDLDVTIYHNHYRILPNPDTSALDEYFLNKIHHKDEDYHLNWLSCNHWSNVINSYMYGKDIEEYLNFVTRSIFQGRITLVIPRVLNPYEVIFRQITDGDYSEFCVADEFPLLPEYDVTLSYNLELVVDKLFDVDDFGEVDEYMGNLPQNKVDLYDPRHASNQILIEYSYKRLIFKGIENGAGNVTLSNLCKQFKTCQRLLTQLSIDYSGVDLFVFIIQCFEIFGHIHVDYIRTVLNDTRNTINTLAEGQLPVGMVADSAGFKCVKKSSHFINHVKNALYESTGVHPDTIEDSVNLLFPFVEEVEKNRFKNFMIGVDRIKFWILLYGYVVPQADPQGDAPPPPPYTLIDGDRRNDVYRISLRMIPSIPIDMDKIRQFHDALEILQRDGFQSLRRRQSEIERLIRQGGYEGYNMYLSYIPRFWISQYYSIGREAFAPNSNEAVFHDQRVAYTLLAWTYVVESFRLAVESQRGVNEERNAPEDDEYLREVRLRAAEDAEDAVVSAEEDAEDAVVSAEDTSVEKEVVDSMYAENVVMSERRRMTEDEVGEKRKSSSKTSEQSSITRLVTVGPGIDGVSGIPNWRGSTRVRQDKEPSEKISKVGQGGTRKRKKQTRKKYSRIKKSLKKLPKTRKTR
jgi:hypothetical protein